MRLYKSMGYQNLEIESNSELLAGWIQKKQCSPWYLWEFWEELDKEMKGVNFSIMHQKREGNKVANYLAWRSEDGIMQSYVAG